MWKMEMMKQGSQIYRQQDLEGCTLLKQGSSRLQGMTLDFNKPEPQSVAFLYLLISDWSEGETDRVCHALTP